VRFSLFKSPERDPAATGECQHSFSNWSAPAEIEVASYNSYSQLASGLPTMRSGWVQDRHCVKCNLYERRCT